MWTFIFVLAAIAAIGGLVYICSRIYKFVPDIKLATPKINTAVRILFCVFAVFAVIGIFALAMGYINAVIIVVHLVIFGLLSDLVFFVIRKLRGKKFKRNFALALGIVVTFVYLSVGYSLANCVWVTPYKLVTDKDIGELRIVMFADSHIGATFDGEGLNEHIGKMQEYDPDIVIVAGDFVDDGTDKQNMIAACAALGTLKTKYGIFFAFGNHDKGYYDDSLRDYSGADLIAELEKNNVTVLQDEAVLIDDRFYVIGRQEAEERRRGAGDRAAISDIVKDLDDSKYMIVINHQPTDYANESAANVDLVLSGHTHGGQMFPLGLIMNIFDLNDRVYGYEKRGDTNFIVTSGISDWEFKFKTGTKSEFVVIDIASAA